MMIFLGELLLQRRMVSRNKSLKEAGDGVEEEGNGNYGMVDAAVEAATLNPGYIERKNWRSKKDSNALSCQEESNDGNGSDSSDDSWNFFLCKGEQTIQCS